MNTIATYNHRPWNKGKLVGQKAPLRLRDIWTLRVRLQLAEKTRDPTLFNSRTVPISHRSVSNVGPKPLWPLIYATYGHCPLWLADCYQ